MDVRLNMIGEDDQELSARLSREMLEAIREDVDTGARLDTRPAAPGERADVITIGAIIMAIVTSGALGKLLDVLNAWITRKPHLVYKLKRADGSELEINSEFCSSKDRQEQAAVCRQFLKI